VSGFGGTRYGVFRSSAASDGGEPGPARLVERGSLGGFFATILSAVALGFSGFSYYDSSLKTADLTVYVPPRSTTGAMAKRRLQHPDYDRE